MTTSRDVFKLLFRQTRPYRGLLGLMYVLIIGGEIIGVISPLFYKQFFDILAANDVAHSLSILRALLFVILGLHAAHWLVIRLAGLISTTQNPKVQRDLEINAFRYLLGHSYSYFTNSFTGSLVRRVRKLSSSYGTITENINWAFVPTATVIISSTIVLAFRSIWLSLGLAAWVIVYVIANYTFALWKLGYDEQRAHEDSVTTAVAADAISNSTNIMTFTSIKHEDGLFSAAIEKWRKIATFSWVLSDISEGLQWGLMILLEFFVMYFAVGFWKQGLLTIGDFALLQSYLISVFIRVWDLGRTIRKTYEAVADAKEMVEIMQTPHEIRDKKNAKELQVKRGEMIFKHVQFSYGKKRNVLDGFDVTIGSKEKVALVGPSGAGKSTVVKLILRFHDIQKGAIVIDGQDVEQVTQDSLRRAIAMVPQDPVLFHRTLMDNIRYGRRDATDEEVIAAAKKAHCHEFISELQDGYNTFVGERGIKLSGGERQRVAIARAILKDAPILILDEATSSLDSESEKLIQDALHELMKNKTTIVIAHRLSTILKMDRIVVMSSGRVVDAGTHQDLIKKEGIYKTLWEIQAGGFID